MKELLQPLHRILCSSTNFYIGPKVAKPEAVTYMPEFGLRKYLGFDSPGATDGKYGKQNKNEPTVPLFVTNINYFGSQKGFDLIVERFKKDPRPSLFVAKSLIRVLINMKDFLTKELLDTFIIDIQKAVFDYLLILSSDDHNRESRQLFKEVGSSIQTLMATTMNLDYIDELIERFNLDMGIRALRTTALEKRLRGMKYVKKIIAKALQKEDKKILQKMGYINHGT